ncbi:LacI family DNA-binding transcriptional regulator [Desertivirga arenae]|uniref:LacI family DNA-binding transcriptional regulator n=1 Tax=Desertivirga arenae TaxID=2810309 RepID=UPI001A96722C|nr:LacI family DNA-binding transcriptional regulator [Pedobacter sp. SYSU D00823]
MSEKPTTIKEIAQILKISTSTVSRALHDHPSIGKETRAKVKKLAKDLNYEPNQTAIFFQKGKTYTIGVILPELSEVFFSSAISAIEEAAYNRNYTVLLAQSHDNEIKEKQLVEKMKNHRVDGLLVSISKNTKSFEHFESLKKYNIPIVFFDRIPQIQNIHYVACNMETGTVEAVNYLLKKGHRTIGLINGPTTLLASKERKEGFIKAMSKNRLKFDPTLVVNCDLTEQGTVEAMEYLLKNKRKPTAIVTFNDYVALYAIKYARLKKLEIGKDVEFVSYANLPLIDYMDYKPVASVEQFPTLQAQKATDTLLDLISQRSDSQEIQAFYKVIIESQLVENTKNN